jgi:pimeloyl-ACP methyl ester carboxylesterase
MPEMKPAFVFVHGGWVDHSIWRLAIEHLQAYGYVARSLDLPGCGVYANAPRSYRERPLDAQAFATEPSPNAGITQEERTAAVVSFVEETAREISGPVVLVSQSLCGLTVTAVAEAIPQQLRAVVYISGFLQSPGMTAIALLQHATLAESQVPPLFLADPRVVGASRIDFQSDNAEYRARIKQALCADVSDAAFSAAVAGANCDEPAGVLWVPAHITAERFGGVPRHYVRCLDDRAIPLEGQDFMIAALDGALGGHTHTHTLASSHFPFYSQPEALTAILRAIVS